MSDASIITETTDESAPKASGRSWKFLVTVGSAFAIVFLQLGQGVLLARLLGPESRGEYATAMFYSQFLLYIGLFGGLEAVCHHATALVKSPDPTNDRSHSLRRASLRLSLVTGLVTAIIVSVLSIAAMPAAKEHLIPLAILSAASVIGQHIMLIMTAVDRGSNQFGTYNIRRIIAAAAYPVLLAIAACVTTMTVPLACGLFIAASIVSAAACLIGLPKPVRGPSHPPVKQMLIESGPYGVNMLATDLFERLDSLLVLWLATLVDQGFYSAMLPAVYPLIVIPNTLGIFLFNTAADRSLRVGEINRILFSSIAVQALFTIVFMLLIAWVVRLVYGPDFVPAVQYAYWLAPASAIKGIVQGLDSYLKGRGRPLAPVWARVVSAAILLAATAFLYPIYGVVAIAMASLMGQVFCLVWLSAIIYADARTSQVA
jgi:enterobacterial common antigen flippase